MKARIYLRVAKSTATKGFVTAAATKPNHGPLTDSYGQPRPTVAFALDLDIPDAGFKLAEQVIAEVAIPEDALKVAASVTPIRETA